MLTGYKTYIGIILLLLPAIQQFTGVQITSEQATAYLDALFTVIGGIVAVYGRYVAKSTINTDTNVSTTK